MEPPYARWGRIAMEQTAAKFPGVPITDYLYVGKFPKMNSYADEVFRLVIRPASEQRTIIVVITIDERSNKMQTIQFQKIESSPYRTASEQALQKSHHP